MELTATVHSCRLLLCLHIETLREREKEQMSERTAVFRYDCMCIHTVNVGNTYLRNYELLKLCVVADWCSDAGQPRRIFSTPYQLRGRSKLTESLGIPYGFLITGNNRFIHCRVMRWQDRNQSVDPRVATNLFRRQASCVF